MRGLAFCIAEDLRSTVRLVIRILVEQAFVRGRAGAERPGRAVVMSYAAVLAGVR